MDQCLDDQKVQALRLLKSTGVTNLPKSIDFNGMDGGFLREMLYNASRLYNETLITCDKKKFLKVRQLTYVYKSLYFIYTSSMFTLYISDSFFAGTKTNTGQRFFSHIRTVIPARIRKALCETMTVTATATVTSKRSRFCKQNNNSARAPRFFEISLPSLHDYDLKWPNCKLFWGRERQGDIFYSAVWTRPSPLSSVPTKVSFFLVIERLRIIAKWLKRMRSLSFNELLMDVAVVGS